jgi:hypothetical protein
MSYPSLTCLLVITMLSLPGCRNGHQEEQAMSKPRRGKVSLVVLSETFAICRLDPGQPIPTWAEAPRGRIFSATATPDELSLILEDTEAPANAKCERGWRTFMVKGPLDFNQVGIVAGLSGALADAGISIFALSTYDTDYVMVKQGDLQRATQALRQAGYQLEEER